MQYRHAGCYCIFVLGHDYGTTCVLSGNFVAVCGEQLKVIDSSEM